MNTSIRPAMLADATAIAHVHVESWKTTYRGIVPDACLAALDPVQRAEQWREWLTGRVHILVAEVAGHVVGFAAGGSLREAAYGYGGELYSLYLLQAAQRQGLGRRLVGALAQQLQSDGLHNMLAWVLEGNHSKGFYDRLGAIALDTRHVDMGGVQLPVVAYGWPSLTSLAG